MPCPVGRREFLKSKFLTYPSVFDFSHVDIPGINAQYLTQVHHLKMTFTFLIVNFAWQRQRDIYVSSKTASKWVPNNYKRYFDYLMDIDIIQESKKEVTGYGTKAYRFLDYSILESLEFEHNPKCKLKSGTAAPENPILDHLQSFFNPLLTIDYQGAYSEVIRQEDTVKKLSHLISLKMFHCGHFYLIQDKHNRVHTNLTNMPKYLRKHIRYDSKDIIGVDIPNAQPLLILMLCKTILEGEDIYRQPLFSPTTNALIGELIEENLYAFDLYRELVSERKFYEYIYHATQAIQVKRDELPKAWASIDAGERAEFKKAILAWINGKIISRNPLVRQIDFIMKEEFNFVHTLVSRLKIIGIEEYGEGNGHKKVAQVLQSLEAEIIFYHICVEFEDRLPEELLLTIHDGIYTTQDNFQKLKSIAEGTFLKHDINLELNEEGFYQEHPGRMLLESH